MFTASRPSPSSHIHFSLFWKQDGGSQLDVGGADAIVVQAEGEAAARVRLRLRAVPPTATRRVPRRCQHAQPTAGGAGGGQVVGEGVRGGRGGGGGGGGGRGGQGGRHWAKRAVVVVDVGDRRLARRDGHPGLPAVGHGAGLGQRGPAVVALLPARCPGRVVAPVEGGCTLESGALGFGEETRHTAAGDYDLEPLVASTLVKEKFGIKIILSHLI